MAVATSNHPLLSPLPPFSVGSCWGVGWGVVLCSWLQGADWGGEDNAAGLTPQLHPQCYGRPPVSAIPALCLLVCWETGGMVSR